MRVLFLPRWAENPYLDLLAEHLERRGLEVRQARAGLLQRPWRATRRRAAVVHLHAAARFHRARSTPGAALRALGSLVSLALLRLRGTRIVWTAHDIEDHDRRHPHIDRGFTWLLARLAHRIITHGEIARGLVRQRFGLHEGDRFAVIPHGPFTGYAAGDMDRREARRRLGVEPDAFVFLFLGAIRPYKGVPELIAAFGRLEVGDARLVIRGRARDADLDAEIARAAAATPRVDYVSEFVPDEAVADWLTACDVVVAPYRAILTSGSVVLAQSLGRPCIAPALGGIPDLVDETCGFLYPTDALDGLERALGEALAARDSLPALGEAARQRATRVTWDEIAERTAAIYRG